MKPVLFNTEMVRAILEGRKTVTRRLIKPSQMQGIAPDRCSNRTPEEFVKEKPLLFKPYCDMTDEDMIKSIFKAPYQIGDILYVRETFAQAAKHIFWYRATPPKGCENILWKPSIHMPKEAARIFLRVTDVRVERLQEITNEGCKAEGTDLDEWYEYDEWQHQVGDGCVADGIPVVFETLRGFFGSRIWNSTLKNKDEYYRYGWDANPWVWVIEFSRMQKAEINE